MAHVRVVHLLLLGNLREELLEVHLANGRAGLSLVGVVIVESPRHLLAGRLNLFGCLKERRLHLFANLLCFCVGRQSAEQAPVSGARSRVVQLLVRGSVSSHFVHRFEVS